MACLLELDHVSHAFGGLRALHELDLNVAEHEIVRSLFGCAPQSAGHEMRERMEPVGGPGELGNEKGAEIAARDVRELVQEDHALPFSRPDARRFGKNEYGVEKAGRHGHGHLRGEEDRHGRRKAETRGDLRREELQLRIVDGPGTSDERARPAKSESEREERHEPSDQPESDGDLRGIDPERRRRTGGLRRQILVLE